MSDVFLAYLGKERARLIDALSKAQSASYPDPAEIAQLRKQKLIVENQLVRWASDFAQEVAAA